MREDKKITSLNAFVQCIHEIRENWRVKDYNELWFRGEDQDYGRTSLRPKIYRPYGTKAIKQIAEILDIENDLCEEFQRCGHQLSNDKLDDEDWDWYLLMQHHGAPTRLLDWSDGALMALHFAIWPGNRCETSGKAFVYVLEPDRLQEQLKATPEIELAKQQWRTRAGKNPIEQLSAEEWERAFLPADDEGREEVNIPTVPLLLRFPHITRRVAAQRSRLMVFGTDPSWLLREYEKPESAIRRIAIEAGSIQTLRTELRDCGITESVIFPDLDGLGREMSQIWEARR